MQEVTFNWEEQEVNELVEETFEYGEKYEDIPCTDEVNLKNKHFDNDV